MLTRKTILGYVVLFIIIMLILFSIPAKAVDYHFSSVSGNDETGNGTISLPWRSLSKLNSFWATLALNPGDRLLLKGGETFYGFIIPAESGTSAAPIRVSSYGTGRATVTGFITIGGWALVSGSTTIYEATVALPLTHLNMVVIDGVNTAMGRWPDNTAADGGYMRFEGFTGTWNGTSTCTIVDNQLTATPSWVGGEVVIKPWPWLINRATITAHSSGTLSFLGDQQPRSVNYGYFIQNHAATLTKYGEWYYNPSTKKIRVYFGAELPANHVVQVAAIDSLVYASGKSYISFSNIDFKGARGNAFRLFGSGQSGVTLDNCTIRYAGIDGVTIYHNHSAFRITNSTVSDCNNNCIMATQTTNAVVTGNTVRNSYTIPGMGGERDGQGHGIRVGAGGLVQYNSVVNSGYIGVTFSGANSVVRENFIDSSCTVKSDAGGIYSGMTGGYVALTGRLLKNNIILNDIGNKDGTPATEYAAHGIYLDDNMNGVLIEGNTVAHGNNTGLMLHNTRDIITRNNTFYNNLLGAVNVNDDANHIHSSGLRFAGNIYATTVNTQSTAIFEDDLDDVGGYLSSDSNVYANLISSNTSIVNIRNNQSIHEFHDLPSWRLRYLEDANGKYSQKVIAPYRDLVIVGGSKIPSPLNNSTMTNSGTGWSNAAYIASAGLDSGALSITPNATVIQSSAINIGEVKINTPYVMRFSVKGGTYSGQGSFGVRLRNLTTTQYHKIISTRQEVELLFVPSASSTSTTLEFLVSEGGATFYLDNIYFYQATATVTNYRDSVMFEYNASKVNKVVSLTGNYMEPNGVSHTTGSVTLAPYTSKVLIKITGTTTTIVKVNPTITWANPSAITYGTALSATQLNATSSVAGTFVYAPVSGTVLNAGTRQLTLTFTPTDQTNYNTVEDTATIVVNKATATLTLGSLAKTYNTYPQSPSVTTTPVAGLTVISMTFNGISTVPTNAGTYTVIAGLTNANYIAIPDTAIFVISKATTPLNVSNTTQIYSGTVKSVAVATVPAGLTGVSVVYSPTGRINAGTYSVNVSLSHINYTATPVSTSLIITKFTPVVSWGTPADMVYPAVLTTTQLNATATGVNLVNLPGTFVYSPKAGDTLSAGVGQILSVNFTPTDVTNYNVVNNKTTTITVTKATATLILGSLAQVYTGAQRLATTTTVPAGLGVVTYTYTGVSPTVYPTSPTAPVNAGTYAVVATLTNANYTGSTSGTLVVSKATATLAFGLLSYVYNGSARTAPVTTVPSGLATVTVTYNGSPTAPSTVGNYVVVATLSNTNYQAASKTDTLRISKATPVIVWNPTTPMTYGDSLKTLATTSPVVAGSFSYSPPINYVPNASTAFSISATFAASDLTNYISPVTKTVSIVINKKLAVITIDPASLSQFYDGSQKPVSYSISPVGLGVVTVTYDGSTTPPTAIGNYFVSVSLLNSNYTATTKTGTLAITASSAAVTITNLSQTYTGGDLPVTVTVAGGYPYSVTYNGSPTVARNAGSYVVVATINDGIHSGADTATLIVNKANPVITWPTPGSIPYGTALSGTQLNATSGTGGIFTYSPQAGTTTLPVGTQTLSTTLAPTDSANYNPATKQVSIVITQATATLAFTASTLSQSYTGSPKTVLATSTPAGLSGITITYAGSTTAPSAVGSYLVRATLTNTNYTATPITDSLRITPSTAASITISNILQVYDGTTQPVNIATNPTGLTYSVRYNGSATVPVNAGSYTVIATITSSGYIGADTAVLVIQKATPVIIWNPTTPMTYGDTLKTTATTASLIIGGGTFSYNPLLNTVPNASTALTISTKFTPTSTLNYNVVSKQVTIVVNKKAAVLTINSASLAQTYDSTQQPVVVTSSPAGLSGITVTYTGISPTVYATSQTAPTNAGSYTVVATLTNANYTAPGVTATLVIAQKTYTLTWGPIQKIKTAVPLSSVQLNATSTIAGTFFYEPPAGTAWSSTGIKQLLATFTPANAGNYAIRTIPNTVEVYGNPNQTFYIDDGGNIIYINE